MVEVRVQRDVIGDVGDNGEFFAHEVNKLGRRHNWREQRVVVGERVVICDPHVPLELVFVVTSLGKAGVGVDCLEVGVEIGVFLFGQDGFCVYEPGEEFPLRVCHVSRTNGLGSYLGVVHRSSARNMQNAKL